MSQALKDKAKAFLDRTVPDEISYVPGSLVEVFLGAYVEGKELDADFIELANIGAQELESSIAEHETDEAKMYFRDCKSLLTDILNELAHTAGR